MTVAAVGAGRAAAAGGARTAAVKRGAGSGRKPVYATVTDKPARTGGTSAAGSAAGGAAAGTGLGELAGKLTPRGSSRAALPGSPARRLLVAEFALCMVVLALSPLTDKNKTESPAAFMKRASAVMAVFFVLGLVGTAGRGASRAAAGFGGLVTLALLISSRSIFPVLAGKFGTTAGERSPDDEGQDQDEEGEPYDRPDATPMPDPQEAKPR